MTEKLEIYKCKICGNVIQVLCEGVGELVCCGENMEHLIPKKDNITEIGEKHSPMEEVDINGRYIRVKKHPMEEEHYVQFIEVYPEDKSALHIKFLRPKDIPEFDITGFEHDVEAVELCNIHGLWGQIKNDK